MKRPLVFGEVLFDVFPDGREILGGAPFNVAWHLQGFGCAPLMIGRVGRDAWGEKILARMRAWGMDLAGMRIDANHPTGIVRVSLRDGQPSYDILPDRAYDYIETADLGRLPDDALLIHGTLAARSPVSARALTQIAGRYDWPVFLDVNLRAPWWRQEIVEPLMKRARWLKLNEDELRLLAGVSPNAALDLLQTTGAEWALVTAGEKGAQLWNRFGNRLAVAATKADSFVDAVGAGDAFCSVVVLGLLAGWPSDIALSRAARFAGEICGIPGATTENRALYDRFLHEWGLA